MSETKIINISGKAEHGKDTLAKLLKKELEKAEQNVLILHYGDYLKFLAKVLCGWNGKKDEKGRKLLQELGTDKVRKKYPNFWVEEVIRQVELYNSINSIKADYVLVPDCRFPNEIELWEEREWSGIPTRVIRTNHVSRLTEEQLNHPSETALDDYEYFDFIVTAEDMKGLEDCSKRLASILINNGVIDICF